ncbi:MAG: amidohydrolase family protein [Cytophagaceae bacterium]
MKKILSKVNKGGNRKILIALSAICVILIIYFFSKSRKASAEPLRSFSGNEGYELNDSHFHLTNYIQKGTDIHQFLSIMGTKVGRTAIFGIPLQQQWSYRVDGKNAPKYYLDSDAPLYYYSFTDAHIAMAYKSLSAEQQQRLDPMITGFNPTDLYAADHIRRVLRTFPGVFSGIREFTIHKEFVSPKIAGGVASISDPALDSILSLAGKIGLVVLMHNDIDKPFPKAGTANYLSDLKALFKRHPKTTIIWAHIGLGRVVHPVKDQVALVEEIVKDPSLNHVHFDISWDEVAKYMLASDTALTLSAGLLNRYPDRFLFGTDVVAPTDQETYLKVYYQYDPLWKLLSSETSEKIRKFNYIRIFDEARRKVRKWEKLQGPAAN